MSRVLSCSVSNESKPAVIGALLPLLAEHGHQARSKRLLPGASLGLADVQPTPTPIDRVAWRMAKPKATKSQVAGCWSSTASAIRADASASEDTVLRPGGSGNNLKVHGTARMSSPNRVTQQVLEGRQLAI